VNTYRIAAVIVRLTGLGYLVGAIIDLTYLPWHILRAQVTRPHTYAAQEASLQISWLYVSILIHVLFGAVLFVGWKRVVLFLTRGVGRIAPVEWPDERQKE
jgi:hypothetical protein